MGAIREQKDPLMVDSAATDLLWGNLSLLHKLPVPLLFIQKLLLFIFQIKGSSLRVFGNWRYFQLRVIKYFKIKIDDKKTQICIQYVSNITDVSCCLSKNIILK